MRFPFLSSGNLLFLLRKLWWWLHWWNRHACIFMSNFSLLCQRDLARVIQSCLMAQHWRWFHA